MATRKIIDAKHNGEKVWLKGHAQATYLSNGSTVEDALNSIQSGGITAETDPIFLASPAASITEAKKIEWDNKMDKVVLSPVATSGNYNDLTNKPTIPASVTESTVSGWGFTKNAGTYSKPSGGIPNSDLSSDVRDALRYAEMYQGTVTSVKINGETKGSNGGVVDLGNVGTYSKPSTGIPKSDLASDVQTSLNNAVQKDMVGTLNIIEVDGVYDGDYVYALPTAAAKNTNEDYDDIILSRGSVKTINGESIVGSGNIEISGGTITGVSANGTSIATSGVANIPAASTSKYGVTKLTTLTNSSSTTLAATASAVKSAYDLANSKQEKLTSGTNIKTVNGESILGSGDLVIGGGNVQAVDTGDVLDDVTVNYATKTYVDGLVGDINSVLESIINGGGNVSIFPITLTIGDNGQSAIDLYNYVTQNHANGVYSFKENEIVKYDSEIITHFNFNYANSSIINTYLDNGYVLVVNQSGVVSVDTGAGN